MKGQLYALIIGLLEVTNKGKLEIMLLITLGSQRANVSVSNHNLLILKGKATIKHKTTRRETKIPFTHTCPKISSIDLFHSLLSQDLGGNNCP